MKRQLYFLIPIGTFIIICITAMYFPYWTIPGIFFRSALFQSVLVFFACFYNFAHIDKKSKQLRKHLSKQKKLYLPTI